MSTFSTTPTTMNHAAESAPGILNLLPSASK